MLRKSIISILLLTIYLGSCLIIYQDEKDINKKIIKTTNIEKNINTANYNQKSDNEIIGTLTIDKINLKKDIYNINSPHNNVDENVTILNDDANLIVLAAHSGPGYIAFFNNLDKLELNDTVNLNYKGKDLAYKVTTIEGQVKDGTIEIDKTNTERLILTTCSKKDKNKQLVLIAKKIDV